MKEKIKQAMIKDFEEILAEEFTTDWKEKRFYIELLIETMEIDNLINLFKSEVEWNERSRRTIFDKCDK